MTYPFLVGSPISKWTLPRGRVSGEDSKIFKRKDGNAECLGGGRLSATKNEAAAAVKVRLRQLFKSSFRIRSHCRLSKKHTLFLLLTAASKQRKE